MCPTAFRVPLPANRRAQRVPTPTLGRNDGNTLRVRESETRQLWEWAAIAHDSSRVFEESGVVGNDAGPLAILNNESSSVCSVASPAQGFVHHDLSRACFGSGTDSIPVWSCSALALYGGGCGPPCTRSFIRHPFCARWSIRASEGTALALRKDTKERRWVLLERFPVKCGGIKADT